MTAPSWMPLSISVLAGNRADMEFARACERAGLSVRDALIGSPLLNLHIAQKKHATEYERERWRKRKAERAA